MLHGTCADLFVSNGKMTHLTAICLPRFHIVCGLYQRNFSEASLEPVSLGRHCKASVQGYLLSGSVDGSIKIWQPCETPAPGAVLDPHPAYSHPPNVRLTKPEVSSSCFSVLSNLIMSKIFPCAEFQK